MGEQLTGTVIAEKYRLDSLLSASKLGDYYRGRHLFMDKPVVLKVLDRSLSVDPLIRDRFTSEARAASTLANPHILAVNDFGLSDDGREYIVFENFDGELLQNSIATGGRFSVERAVAIACQVGAALETAHANGFIHGELTPAKILVANTENAVGTKVFDMNPVSEGELRRSEDRSTASVAYLAPETFAGLRPIDGRSDIYGLGVILYQMLAGEAPFTGETPTDVMLKHAEEEAAPLSYHRKDVQPRIEAAIRKALAKNPDERFQTAAEFVAELENAAVQTASTGRFWKTAFGVVLGTAALGSALIYATWTKQTDPVTQLMPDANGQPVQPINPATGAEEQALLTMPGSIPGSMSNTDIIAQPPGTLPGGDNYNPWATGVPPPGAPPQYVAPGGQVYTIDPNTGSPFMPNDSGVVLVPVPANSNTGAARPSPTPRAPAANADTQPANTTTKPAQSDKVPAASNPARPDDTAKPKPSPEKAKKPGSIEE